MDKKLEEKYGKLSDIVRDMKKICVAFSGGVDSTLILKVSRDILDAKRVLAVTAVSTTYTASDRIIAEELAGQIGVKHIMLTTDETGNSEFTENTPERCYFCKKSFYRALIPIAHVHGFATICDGSNTDDLSDYRPGRRAAAEFGIRSPLIEAEMSKDDVRALSRELGIPGWERPANPCLASRIPYGTKITDEKLAAVEQSEEFIRSLGFPVVRVRHFGDTARIEVPEEDLQQILNNGTRRTIAQLLKGLGFTWVCVDIEGYRMGSLNRQIDAINKTENLISDRQ